MINALGIDEPAEDTVDGAIQEISNATDTIKTPSDGEALLSEVFYDYLDYRDGYMDAEDFLNINLEAFEHIRDYGASSVLDAFAM